MKSLGTIKEACSRSRCDSFKWRFPGVDVNTARLIQKDSTQSGEYNCFSWALEVTDKWLDSSNWFEGYTLKAFVEGYKAIGYKVTKRPQEEQVAIYGFRYGRGRYTITHVARRTEVDGVYVWTSKLGGTELITHKTLQDVEGDRYGQVVQILSRRKSWHTSEQTRV